MPLLLLGSSCKKQEKLNQEKLVKKIQKADLIGVWNPIKIITLFNDGKDQIIMVDSSETVKSYVPAYQFKSDKLIVDHVLADYQIISSEKNTNLEYLRYNIKQFYNILELSNEILVLKNVNIEETGVKTETVYYNKKK